MSYLLSQVISCDQNLNRCCELIELTAKIQGQLFAILNLTAAEGKFYICISYWLFFSFMKHYPQRGWYPLFLYLLESGGHYAGVDTLKMRLLPWLGTCFSMARPSVTDDTSLQLIQVTTSFTRLKNTKYIIHKPVKLYFISSLFNIL